MHDKDFHVLALVKGEHHFVYIFDKNGWDELVETLCEQAEDEGLNFSWFDAAILSHRAKSQLESDELLRNENLAETEIQDSQKHQDSRLPK